MLNRVFQYYQKDLSTGPLVIPARANRGYRILEIGVSGTGAGQGVIVTVNDERHLFVPGINGLGNVAYPKFINLQTAGFMEQLYAQFPDLPVIHAGGDESITFERTNAGGACTVYVWYQEDLGDELPDPALPGGSLSDDRIVCQFSQQLFTVGAGVTATFQVTDSDMPSGFRGFPFTEVTPSNRYMDFLGMVIAADLSGAANTTINGVRVWKQEQSQLGFQELFVPVEVFPDTNAATDKRIALFKEPIRFDPNDECKVEYNFTNAGGGAETPIMFTSLIFHQIPV